MPAWSSKNTSTDRPSLFAAVLLLVLLSITRAAAQPALGGGNGLGAEPRFLPVEEAFTWHVSRDSDRQLSILWEIAPDYYLYREQFRFTRLDTGDALRVSLPDGSRHHDVYFGDVEVYYDTVRAMVQLPVDRRASLRIQIRFQGCAEAGLCYPPQTETLTIEQ